jgi:hypothetical protein
MKIAIPLSFTDKQLVQITRALPKGASPHRLGLLPRVLRYWAENDLEEHASLGRSGASIKEEGKQYEKLIATAAALAKAIDAVIEADNLIIIAVEMGDAEKTIPMRDRLAHYINKINDQRGFLNDLVAAIVSFQKRTKSSRGRPRNTTAYVVLTDIAAIYEWAIGLKAHREVSRRNGTETGPFYQFLLLFGRLFSRPPMTGYPPR